MKLQKICNLIIRNPIEIFQKSSDFEKSMLLIKFHSSYFVEDLPLFVLIYDQKH